MRYRIARFAGQVVFTLGAGILLAGIVIAIAPVIMPFGGEWVPRIGLVIMFLSEGILALTYRISGEQWRMRSVTLMFLFTLVVFFGSFANMPWFGWLFTAYIMYLAWHEGRHPGSVRL